MNIKKLSYIVLFCFTVSCAPGELINAEKSNSYFVRSGRVVFCQQGNTTAFGIKKCDADLKSIEILSNYIIRDKEFIYFRGKKQKHVDYQTFYMDDDIPKDKSFAYMRNIREGLQPIEHVDATSFQYVEDKLKSWGWSKDKDHFYLNLKKVNVDYNSFKLLNKGFAIDKDSLYGIIHKKDSVVLKTRTRALSGIGASSTKILAINSEYIMVEDSLYFIAKAEGDALKKVAVSSKDKIRLLNDYVLCMGEQVIVTGELFKYKDVDANTFEVLRGGLRLTYARDKNHVYFDQEIIKGADPIFFEKFKGSWFSKDNKHVYYKAELLEANSKTFKAHKNVWKDDFGNAYNRKGGKITVKGGS